MLCGLWVYPYRVPAYMMVFTFSTFSTGVVLEMEQGLARTIVYPSTWPCPMFLKHSVSESFVPWQSCLFSLFLLFHGLFMSHFSLMDLSGSRWQMLEMWLKESIYTKFPWSHQNHGLNIHPDFFTRDFYIYSRLNSDLFIPFHFFPSLCS